LLSPLKQRASEAVVSESSTIKGRFFLVRRA
jgi:hypothetical protein